MRSQRRAGDCDGRDVVCQQHGDREQTEQQRFGEREAAEGEEKWTGEGEREDEKGYPQRGVPADQERDACERNAEQNQRQRAGRDDAGAGDVKGDGCESGPHGHDDRGVEITRQIPGPTQGMARRRVQIPSLVGEDGGVFPLRGKSAARWTKCSA